MHTAPNRACGELESRCKKTPEEKAARRRRKLEWVIGKFSAETYIHMRVVYQRLGISKMTLRLWLNEFPDLDEAIRQHNKPLQARQKEIRSASAKARALARKTEAV